MWKRKAENVALRRDRHELDAIDCVGHRGSAKPLAGIEMPKSPPSCPVNRLQRLCIVSEKYQSTGGGQRSTPGFARTHLRVTPSRFSVRHRERQQNFLRVFIGRELGARVVVGLTSNKVPGPREKLIATLKRNHIEEPGIWIVRRREPVSGAVDAGTDICALRRWNSTRENRTTRSVYVFGPIQFLHERSRVQKSSIGPVENIEKAIPVGLYQQASPRAALLRIHQDRGFIRIVVVQIVRRELEVPFQFARIGVESQHASRIKIVAGAGVSHKVRRRITGCPIQSIEFRIIGTGHPGRPTSVKIGIVGPTRGAKLPGPGYCPETPHQLSSLRIVGGHKSADSGVATGSTHDHRVFHYEWRAGGAVLLGLIGIFNVPAQAARASVEAEQMSIIGFYVNRIVPYGNTAVFVRGRIIE